MEKGREGKPTTLEQNAQNVHPPYLPPKIAFPEYTIHPFSMIHIMNYTLSLL